MRTHNKDLCATCLSRNTRTQALGEAKGEAVMVLYFLMLFSVLVL